MELRENNIININLSDIQEMVSECIDRINMLFEDKMPFKYWTKERCYDEAKKYKRIVDFRTNGTYAYEKAKQNGWLKDYTWLEGRTMSDKPIYVVYCYKDNDTNSVYVGLSNNLVRRHNEHKRGILKHGVRMFDIVYKYFHSLGKEVPEPIILKKDLYVKDAKYYEDFYITKYRNDGLNVLNLAKAGSIGGYGKWTKDACYNEAKKYKSRSEFKKNNGAAYAAARRERWLDDYTWFKEKAKYNYWNYETCYKEAKKYPTRTDFQNGSKRAYEVARSNGWLDDYTWFKEILKKTWLLDS